MTFSNDDGDDNENVEKAIGFLRKTQKQKQTCECITLLLYISLPLLHDYDVKMPIFTFYGERK